MNQIKAFIEMIWGLFTIHPIMTWTIIIAVILIIIGLVFKK